MQPPLKSCGFVGADSLARPDLRGLPPLWDLPRSQGHNHRQGPLPHRGETPAADRRRRLEASLRDRRGHARSVFRRRNCEIHRLGQGLEILQAQRRACPEEHQGRGAAAEGVGDARPELHGSARSLGSRYILLYVFERGGYRQSHQALSLRGCQSGTKVHTALSNPFLPACMPRQNREFDELNLDDVA